jgi:SAM-dependent methyltransferase
VEAHRQRLNTGLGEDDVGFFRKFGNIMSLLGLHPGRPFRYAIAAPRFVREMRRYSRLRTDERFPIRLSNLKPILLDYHETAGQIGGHYFFQDLWAARKIFAARPGRHIDIGSRIDGFIAHVLSFMPVTMLDIRPLHSPLPELTFEQADATNLAGIADDSVESLSSLHAIEHFGLGRYGDPINPNGCFEAMRSLMRVLRPGGRLYFSLPVGVERVEFNAHRVFAPATILRTLDRLKLCSFSAVDDAGAFLQNVDPQFYSSARFACGMFEFTKV